jgi:hypothetical protein
MSPLFKKSASLKSLRRIRSRFFYAFILLISPLLPIFSQFQEVHSFDKDWLIYESSWKSFLPYISNKHYSYRAKSVLVDTRDYPQAFLKIKPTSSYYLFLNGTYQAALQKDSLYLFSLDSLKRNNSKGSNLAITLYKEDLNGLPSQMSIVKNWVAPNQSTMSQFSWAERIPMLKLNFMGISLLVILLLLALYHQIYPKYFYAYFQFSDWINWRIKDNVIQNMPFAFPNLFVLAIISLLSAFIGFFNLISQSEYLNAQGVAMGLGFSLSFILGKAFLAFILFLSRYFMYLIFSTLFKIEFLAKLHFYKTIQTNIQFFGILYLSLILLSLYFGPMYQPNLTWIRSLVFAYFLVRFFYFFQTFRIRYSINVITLVAYLIIIEGQVILFGINQILFPQMNE